MQLCRPVVVTAQLCRMAKMIEVPADMQLIVVSSGSVSDSPPAAPQHSPHPPPAPQPQPASSAAQGASAYHRARGSARHSAPARLAQWRHRPARAPPSPGVPVPVFHRACRQASGRVCRLFSNSVRLAARSPMLPITPACVRITSAYLCVSISPSAYASAWARQAACTLIISSQELEPPKRISQIQRQCGIACRRLAPG